MCSPPHFALDYFTCPFILYSPMLSHIATFHSLYCYSVSIVQIQLRLFLHEPVGERLGCSQFISNKVAIHVCGQAAVSGYILTYLG